MKLSSLSIIILSLAALLAIANATAAPAAWTAVADVNDKSIQQVGQFAVRIYGLSMGRIYLRFVNVVSGQTQPYNGGYNPGAATARYDAAVWGVLGTTSWKLLSFTPAK